MLTMEWSLIEMRGYPMTGVYGFSSCVTQNDDIYIFGGTLEPNINSQKLFKFSVKLSDALTNDSVLLG